MGSVLCTVNLVWLGEKFSTRVLPVLDPLTGEERQVVVASAWVLQRVTCPQGQDLQLGADLPCLGTFRVVEMVKEKLSTSVKHSDKTGLPRHHIGPYTVQHHLLQESEVKLISLKGLRVENY